MGRKRISKVEVIEPFPLPRANTIKEAIEAVKRNNYDLKNCRSYSLQSRIPLKSLIDENKNLILPKLRSLLKEAQQREINENVIRHHT